MSSVAAKGLWRLLPRLDVCRLLLAISVISSDVCGFLPSNGAGGELHWNYQDQTAWSNIPGSTCGGDAAQQSPVDLLTAQAEPGLNAPVEIETFDNGAWELPPVLGVNASWTMANVTLKAGGGTWHVTLAEWYSVNTRLRYFNQEFYLEGWSYHSPSEMAVDGKHADMEVQYLHRSKDGQSTLILSVLLQVGLVEGGNHFMSQFWTQVPADPSSPEKSMYIYGPYSAQARDVLPADRSFFVVNGSLTEPPCTVGVIRVVFKERVLISYEQRDRYRGSLSFQSGWLNNDAVQPDGVTLSWDATLGTNNRQLQPLKSQVKFVQMQYTAPPSTLNMNDMKASHLWVWVVAVCLSVVLLIGLCTTCVVCFGALGGSPADRKTQKGHRAGTSAGRRRQEEAVQDAEMVPLTSKTLSDMPSERSWAPQAPSQQEQQVQHQQWQQHQQQLRQQQQLQQPQQFQAQPHAGAPGRQQPHMQQVQPQRTLQQFGVVR
eukprot:TRINITY_DN12383_c0_g1_i1.p1 TRINITY_DN12383_c0_g1~~TRINITY_DN12383_c0_g1_i1.p1  ORF type:complete len:487 (+),score=118.80 TRINITY_DN12383_c0_g1_i1:66-1526(+)